MAIDLPESIRAMMAEPELHEGISELSDKLDGKKMVAASWSQSRDYARALGMAALARSDYVVLMHDLWDASWGAAGAHDLGKAEFDASCDPRLIWDSNDIWLYIRLHRPLEGAVYAVFYVEFELQEGVWLKCSFEDEHCDVPGAAKALDVAADHWTIYEPEPGAGPYLRSQKIKSSDLENSVETLRADAEALIRAVQGAAAR